ncbi:hypothetical protein T492DRAFT_862758 [Pavlovales sp. CCMP2436]|nr:hypothetical protein T492DRAFT_862758 [Pavlovales sp. CCMP2436]
MLHRKPSHRPTLPEIEIEIVTYCEELLDHFSRKEGKPHSHAEQPQQQQQQQQQQFQPPQQQQQQQQFQPPQQQPQQPAVRPPSSASDRSCASERDERLSRRAAEFIAAQGGHDGAPLHAAVVREHAAELPHAAAAPPSAGGGGQPQQQPALAGRPAAALRVLPLPHGGAELGERRHELGPVPSRAALAPGGYGGAQGGQQQPARGIVPEGGSARPAEGVRQQLLAQREEERRQRLMQANVPGSLLRPPHSSGDPSSRAPSTPSSARDSEGGERDLFALAARMHRMQLEAALWREPWRPSGGEAEHAPPPLPTPPGRDAPSEAASQLSRRSYNIFTHEWTEMPIHR